MEQRAIAIMRAHPLRQLLRAPLFVYRAAMYLMIPLSLVAYYALRTRRSDQLVLITPARTPLLFYAVFTDYITRYAVPAVPLAIVAASASIRDLRARRRVKESAFVLVRKQGEGRASL